ncbi:MAG TPA: AAA family ATPase [Bryobacteraceae bacterium]|nr:AAA family ATPase [Bryobacteraceae bacterium]
MEQIRIDLLGNLRITCGQTPVTSVNTKRLQSLLAYLLLHGAAPQSREQIAFSLWPESSEPQARTNLRQLLHHLRRALPADCYFLRAEGQTVHWRPDPACAVDVFEFESAVTRADEEEKRGNLAAAKAALEEAARLYQDDLLTGVYDEWLVPRREQLRRQLLHVLSRLAELAETLGDFPAGIRHAGRLLALDPLSEVSYQLLIRLHARHHDRASALRVYHQCLKTLKRELGVLPGQATLDLFQQVLKSEPIPEPPARAPDHAAVDPPPIVGRARELEQLRSCWSQVTQGETRLALILGEPGIGKSRLAGEMLQFCSRQPGVSVARARCYIAHGQLAYGPIAEWLRAEPLRSARALLPAPQLAALARVLPEILIEHPEMPPPPPLTESWQRRHFYEALNAAFSRAGKPLLLVIDDLQWCDADSFEFLHSLLQLQPAGRTLVLGTARPEETGRDHPLTALASAIRQTGQLIELPIAPLDHATTAALAEQVGKREFDPAFLAELYRSTRGNPLFVVESVRAQAEGPARLAAAPRVQAVIAARLAQLSPSAYELAGLAAAIGNAFSFELLSKATDWDEDSLSRALEELWQRRLIEGHGAGAYDYSHDLLRDVAYAGLSPVRRRFLHRRVARALEELHAADPESVSGRLAAHYEAAGMDGEAIRCYLAAAAVARRRYADVEAAALIRRALALAKELPESSRRDRQELVLLVTLGPALVTRQGYSLPEVGQTYERALALSRRLGEKQHLYPALGGSWLFHMVRGSLEESRGLGLQCLAAAEGEPALSAAGHFFAGSSLFHLGRLDLARQHLEKALAAHGGRSHPALALFAGPDVGVFCRSYLSHVLSLAGPQEEALRTGAESVALARALSNPFSLAIALDYAAMLHAILRQAKPALDLAAEAAALCRKHDFGYYLSWSQILTGWAAALQGDAAGGLAGLRAGLDALKSTGVELRLPFYYGLLAEVCALAGQQGEALASVASGFAFQSKNGEDWAASELHRIHGDLLRLAGNAAGAKASYAQAIEAARRIGAPLFETRASERLRKLAAAASTRS